MDREKKLGTAKTLFSVIVFIFNLIVPVNLTLCSDVGLFMIFLAVGIVASCWSFTVNKYFTAVASAISGAVLTIIVVPSIFSCICALITLPFGLSFMYVKDKRLNRGTAVSIGAGVSSALLIGYFVINTYLTQGQLTPDTIVSAYGGFFDVIRDTICSSAVIEVAGVEVPLVTPSGADKYLHAILAIIPGAMFATFSVISYFSSWIFKKLYVAFTGDGESLSEWKPRPSVITSVLFLIAMLLTYFLNGADPISYTVMNVALILAPVLFISGLNSAFEFRIINGIMLPRLLRPALLILSLLLGSGMFIALCLVFGVYDSVKTAFPKRKTTNDRD